MSYISSTYYPTALPSENIKTEALYLTWKSLFIATFINLFFFFLPIPGFIYVLAAIIEFGLIFMLWFFMPKTESGRTKLLYLFVITSSILLSATIQYTVFTYTNGFLIVVGALGVTSIVTGIMYYISLTKTPNLNAMGKYLFIGLIGLLIVSVLGIFIVYSAFFELLISIFGAALFSLYILYDLSRLERQAFTSPAMMALSLYWDILLLFRYLLRLLIILFGERD